MKTVKQYLELIPDPEVRSKALANHWKEYGSEKSDSLPAALFRAFLWHKAPEGYDYWKKIHAQLKEQL